MLSLRGNVLEHGAPRFFRRLAEGVFDLDDLRVRTGQLADFIGAAAARYGFSTSRLCAVGYSNGANIAASLLLTQPDVLGAAVLYRAMVPFEPETLPALGAKKVLVSAGPSDPMIPRTGTERLVQLLVDAGAQVELTWQESAHGLVQGDVTIGQKFVADLVSSGG